MLSDGSLIYGSGRTLTLPQGAEMLVGVLRAHRRGFAFIECPGRPDTYVARGHWRQASDGDTVLARLVKPRRRGGALRAEVVRVIERAALQWVGVLEPSGSHWVVRPLGRTSAPRVTIVDPTAESAQPGDMVVVKPVEGGSGGRAVRGRIVARLGDPEKTRTKILAVIRRYALPDRFPVAARRAAERAARLSTIDFENREDLRKRLTITVDPVDARDFDDAISIRRLSAGRCELGVHIADVAHFVRSNGPLDEAARLHGTSVYFPGHVLPMLPQTLSTDVCSLRPGEARLTKSVFITYDRAGQVLTTRLANTVIRSRARLTYEQVSAALDGKLAGIQPAVARLLETAKGLAGRIQARRVAEGMIALFVPEVEIRLDAAGEIVDAGRADASFSHTIIEMFMVEANEAVSRLLTENQVPHLRRIHPEPEPEALRDFARISTALGQRIPAVVDREAIRGVLDDIRGRPAESAINLLLLRCMSQACYSPSDEGHFALASADYCHFTSPIRRYPDLVVHRLLDSYLRGALAGSHRGRRAELISESELAELGRENSTAERRAQQAEREAKSILLLGLMKSNRGKEFDGTITGVAPFGAFVQLVPNMAEGLVRVTDFPPGTWNFDATGGRFVGGEGRRVVTLGQVVRVLVAAVDELRQEMVLVPAPGHAFGILGTHTKVAKRSRGRGRSRNGRKRGGMRRRRRRR
jgi:ribonuclease R